MVSDNVLNRPASTGLKTLTLSEYQRAVDSGTNALLRKLVGAAGTFSIELTTRQLVKGRAKWGQMAA